MGMFSQCQVYLNLSIFNIPHNLLPAKCLKVVEKEEFENVRLANLTSILKVLLLILKGICVLKIIIFVEVILPYYDQLPMI